MILYPGQPMTLFGSFKWSGQVFRDPEDEHDEIVMLTSSGNTVTFHINGTEEELEGLIQSLAFLTEEFTASLTLLDEDGEPICPVKLYSFSGQKIKVRIPSYSTDLTKDPPVVNVDYVEDEVEPERTSVEWWLLYLK